jgi:cytidylate kinase
MSEQDVTSNEVKIDPNEEITDAKKLYLLNEWKKKVEQELADYNAEKDKIYQAYKKQKDKYDAILSVKLKKIKKYDLVINSRRKVLNEVVKEIEGLTPPTPSTQ